MTLVVDPIRLSPHALDLLLPMHVRLSAEGRIDGAGPALLRLAGARLAGRPHVDAVFRVQRPARLAETGRLMDASGQRLILSFRDGRATRFRGHFVPDGDGGGVLNLSLHLSELGNLGGADLTSHDFAPTDLTVDMLYLLEAKSLAMGEVRRLIGRLQEARRDAEALARTDNLTGLRNRRGLDEVFSRLDRGTQDFAVCQVDLDFFKAVNDGHGHAAGDAVLVEVAQRLLQNTRGTDIVARVGGDEFIIVYSELTDPAQLQIVGERIIACLEEPFDTGGAICTISASLGTVISSDYDIPDPARMIMDADRALYRAKSEGRGRHHLFRPRRKGA